MTLKGVYHVSVTEADAWMEYEHEPFHPRRDLPCTGSCIPDLSITPGSGHPSHTKWSLYQSRLQTLGECPRWSYFRHRFITPELRDWEICLQCLAGMFFSTIW